jgi:hypothetical protein
MALLQPLLSLLVAALLAAGLLGAGLASAAHVHDEVRFEQVPFDQISDVADECCQDAGDRGTSCTSVMAVAPDTSSPSPAWGGATTITFRPVDMSDGRDPHDLLDPPRTA